MKYVSATDILSDFKKTVDNHFVNSLNGYKCCIHFFGVKIYMRVSDTRKQRIINSCVVGARKYSRWVGHYFELTTEDNQMFEIQFNKDDFKHLTGISSLLSNGKFNTKLNSPQTCVVFVVTFKCCIPSNSKIINPFTNLHLKLTTYTTLV